MKKRISLIALLLSLCMLTPMLVACDINEIINNLPIPDLSETETTTNAPEKTTFIFPVEGEIYKKHDPSLQVWSQTYGAYKVHLGIDVQTAEGAPVFASADGVISEIWNDALMGICVSIDHGNGFCTIYKNLDETLIDGISEGVKVTQGQQIGKAGETAISEIADGPHLHFEITKNGNLVDPLKYLEGNDQNEVETAPPIPEDIAFIFPVEGEIYKKHDPSLQVWSETYSAYKVHLGIDVQTAEGAPVFASADGVISEIWNDALMGICVSIDHGNGFCTIYKNLDETLIDGISEGVKVTQGQQIGKAGETAISEIADGPHLHFEITKNGNLVDPMNYLTEN